MARNLDILISNCFVAMKIECYDTSTQGLMIHCHNLAQNMLKSQLWKNMFKIVLKFFTFGFNNFINEIPKQIPKLSTILEIHSWFYFLIFSS